MTQGVSNEIDRGNRRYMAKTMAAPLLSRDREVALARAWRDHRDEAALHELVTAYARFVVRIAWGFRGYGLPIGDLVQEGNIGLMEAAARFDAERNARFSTYAMWWIMAAIQDYVLRHKSIVRVATTPTQRRLFFNLRRLRAAKGAGVEGALNMDEKEELARELGVKVTDIEIMEVHLSGSDSSLNRHIGEEVERDEHLDRLPDPAPSPEDVGIVRLDGETRSKWLAEALDALSPRERQIIVDRFLTDERHTLADIGAQFGVSKERIRQIEAKALDKLKGHLKERVSNPADLLVS